MVFQIYLGAIVLLTALVWFFFKPRWMGLEGKTLWDWVAPLSLPFVLGLGTFVVASAQQDIERERASEEAFQHFVDRITNLVLDERATASPETLAAIGRAQSVAILRLVEGERAGRVFAFLEEMDLLHRFAVEFEKLDLSGAELKDINLSGLDFEGGNLSGADMENSDLRNTDFEDANLSNADMKAADLRGASLEMSNLEEADLDHADLRGVDLRQVLGLEEDQLGEACLDETTQIPARMKQPTGETSGCTGEPDD